MENGRYVDASDASIRFMSEYADRSFLLVVASWAVRRTFGAVAIYHTEYLVQTLSSMAASSVCGSATNSKSDPWHSYLAVKAEGALLTGSLFATSRSTTPTLVSSIAIVCYVYVTDFLPTAVRFFCSGTIPTKFTVVPNRSTGCGTGDGPSKVRSYSKKIIFTY